MSEQYWALLLVVLIYFSLLIYEGVEHVFS
jgi:hypothetical protein